MTSYAPRRFAAAVLAAVLVAAAPFLATADVLPPGDQRTELTADTLMSGTGQPDQPVHNAWFMPVGEVAPALHGFSGTLVLPETRTRGFDADGRADGWAPAFDLRFISHDGYLIPLDADIIDSTGASVPGQLIVSPGRVWSEPSDGGLSRASFAFVLIGGTWQADAHNGLATFVYDDEVVSDLIFQVVQETSPDDQYVAFGRLDAAYDPHNIAAAGQVIEDFEHDMATRLPVRPLAELEEGLSPRALITLNGLQTNVPVSATGVVMDDVLYLGPCETHYGDFPYCEEMRHGVYSVTKSLGGMVAMLYLAEAYGDEVFDFKVKDYLDVPAGHGGWDDVTFGDLLSMASGIGEENPDNPQSRYISSEDEDAPTLVAFHDAAAVSGKLEAALAGSNYPWGPGEVFRYRNMDSFILAAAMDALVKSREGPDATLWDRVTDGVWRPIGMTALPMSHTLEADGSRGIPLMAAGAFPNAQDIAKVATLLQNDGRYGDQQLLSKTKLDEALYRTEVRGLGIGGGSTRHYHMSLWHLRMWFPNCYVDVPSMRGYGGNRVVLLPNGVTAFRFSDDRLGIQDRLAEAVSEIRPLCSG